MRCFDGIRRPTSSWHKTSHLVFNLALSLTLNDRSRTDAYEVGDMLLIDPKAIARACQSDLSDLRNNIPPTPSERIYNHEAETRLPHLLLHSVDAILQPEYSDLCGYTEISSSRLAPIRRLHSDVLSLVFLHTDHHRQLRIGHGPLHERGRYLHAFSEGCQQWRNVALSTARLWSSFSFLITCSENSLNLLRLYLLRDAAAPLSFNMFADDPSKAINQASISEVVERSENWAHLHMSFHSAMLPHPSPIRGRLSRLESLSISVVDPDTLSALASINLFEIAPRLSALTLDPMNNWVPVLPFDQIRTIIVDRLHSKGPGGIRSNRVLSRFPHLHTLLYTERIEMDKTNVGLICLPELQVISLLGGAFDDGRHSGLKILDDLITPVLNRIELGPVLWSQATMSDYLKRSGCHLQEMALDNVSGLRASDLLELFPNTPTLQTLCVRKLRPNAITDKLLNALTVDEDRVLLPALAKLTVSGSSLFRAAALVHMLESRAYSPATDALQHVELQLGHLQYTPEDLARFRALGVFLR